MKGEIGDEVEAKYENQNPCEFDAAMGDDVVDEIMGTFGETEIWRGSEQDEDLIADSSIFYNVFPTLPDFPCMSSTSSSSSTPALSKKFFSSSASSASSASSTSWAVMKSDAKQKQQGLRSIKYEADAVPAPALSSTNGFQPSDGTTGMEDVDCMDMMENFGYMDLIEDGNDGWDPLSIFQNDDDQTNPEIQQYQIDQGCIKQEQQNQEDGSCYIIDGEKEVVQEMMGLDELGVMFFEWLKTNKEHISAEDMRNIKFKKATIECAYKRLGSTKEGRKQLLKLILQWVEQYQLQKKRSPEEAAAATSHQVPCQYQEPFTNPNPNSNFMNFIPIPDVNTCMWSTPTPQTYIDQATVAPAVSAPAAFPPHAVAYHHPFVGGANAASMNCQPYPPQMLQTEYQMFESSQSWRSQCVLTPQYNLFPDQNANFVPIAPQLVAPVYREQYPSQVYSGTNSERLVRLGPSATKEARKKRMARKKRGSLHRHHPHQNQPQKIDSPEQSKGKLGVENRNINGQSNRVNWLYWPAAIGAPMLAQPPMEAQPQQLECQLGYPTLPPVQAQSNHRQAQSERGQQQLKKQGCKSEKNLKFLLQKVLKQSDVGNLGRIVLPKKEAETQFPQLEERDGIQIAMEDIGTSKVWNLRYSLRFWPNNKSRMYVLENTGEFVKANGLQEGDFIVIYFDTKCGKYLIRGVKVRQPVGGKFEVKSMRKNHRSSGAGMDIPLRKGQ